MTYKTLLVSCLLLAFAACSDKKDPDRSRFLKYAVGYFEKEEHADVTNIRIDTILFMSSRKAEILRTRFYELQVRSRLSINHYLRIAQLDSVEERKKQLQKLPDNDIIGYRVKFLLDYIDPSGKREPGVLLKTFDTQYRPMDEFDWLILVETELFLIDNRDR